MKMKIALLASLAVASAFGATATAATAQLAGDTVSYEYDFPDLGSTYGNYTATPSTFVVGAGQESVLTVDGFPIGIDFSDSSLTITLPSVPWSTSSFNGPVFTDLTKAFPSVSSVSGIDFSRVLVSGDQLSINWNGLSFNDGDQVVVNFGAVPEPATWGLMIVGFGAVGGAMRRRATRTSVRYA